MMIASLSVGLSWLMLTLATVEAGLVADAELTPPGAKLEKLWGDGFFTEGGALAGDGSILFSDIGERIMRFDPATGKTTVFREPSGRANGMVFNSQGELIVAEGANTNGNRRVSITGTDGKVRTAADRYQGKRFNSPNDVAIDAQGRIYVSDPRYVGDEPRELDDEAVYRIDPDGSVHKLATTAKKPNGLAVSADQATLYVADNGPERKVLLALKLDAKGEVSDPKVLVDFGKTRGIDGMTVTTDGKIVATLGGGSTAGVYVFDAQGQKVGWIPTPETPANLEFGGPHRSTLYIMAGKSLYRIETHLKGHHLWPPVPASAEKKTN